MASPSNGHEKVRASRYHSPLRAKQAVQTRHAIVTAAIRLFRERGWAATTLSSIAQEAGTSVDTIYATFGTKSELLMVAVDVAIVGDDEVAAMIDRPDFALLGSGRRTQRVRAGVNFAVAVFERSLPILRALREAAASDDAARARLVRYDQDRRDVTAAGLNLILGRLPGDEIVDAVWALVSPEVFTYLNQGRGWSVGDTEAWLARMATVAMGTSSSSSDNVKTSARSNTLDRTP